MSKIEAHTQYEAITVTIDDKPHLWLDRTRLLGMKSWFIIGQKQFFIEFAFTHGHMVVDYDDQQKWETVLYQLEAVLLGYKT